MKNNITANNFIGSYLSFEKAFNADECLSIINLFENKIDSVESNLETNTANTNFLNIAEPENNWLTERLLGYINEANKYFNLDISVLKELQILKCNSKGFFDWHYDIGKDETATRKISLIVFLSKPESYQGGQITFSLVEPRIDEVVQNQGTILLFPSIRPHMSDLITSGIRYTLNGWMHGNTFR